MGTLRLRTHTGNACSPAHAQSMVHATHSHALSRPPHPRSCTTQEPKGGWRIGSFSCRHQMGIEGGAKSNEMERRVEAEPLGNEVLGLASKQFPAQPGPGERRWAFVEGARVAMPPATANDPRLRETLRGLELVSWWYLEWSLLSHSWGIHGAPAGLPREGLEGTQLVAA